MVVFIKRFNGLIPISSRNGCEDYLEKMGSRMENKIDFLLENKDKFNLVVDIGCANGSLLISLKNSLPFLSCIGYDLDDKVIKLAKNKVSEKGLDIVFTSNKLELVNIVKNVRKKIKILRF